MKWSHAYRDYAGAFNAEILNSFNSELQLKDSEYSVRNKTKHLLDGLKGFKFMTSLVWEFKKMQSSDETKYRPFTYSQRLKQLLIRAKLVLYLNQSTVRLYKTYRNL